MNNLRLISDAVPQEGPAEHCRNALAILRWSLEHDEPVFGNDGPGIAVPITSLARIQARLEVAIEQLESPLNAHVKKGGTP